MATIYRGIGTVSATNQRGGAFRRVLARFAEARERQAMRHVNGYLLALDDATLATYGYDREALRRGAGGGTPL